MPAEYWYVPRVICAEIPSHLQLVVHSDMGRSVVSLSFDVEYPCLASPGPSRTIVTVGCSRVVCWAFYCLQGFVSIASIELPASLPELR